MCKLACRLHKTAIAAKAHCVCQCSAKDGSQRDGPSVFEKAWPRAPHADVAAQSIGLLAAERDPRAAARFLRRCPELSKATIGELLGEPSDFFLAVLAEFVRTFDFKGARRSCGKVLCYCCC